MNIDQPINQSSVKNQYHPSIQQTNQPTKQQSLFPRRHHRSLYSCEFSLCIVRPLNLMTMVMVMRIILVGDGDGGDNMT